MEEGGRVRLSNSQGQATTTVKLQPRVPKGQAFFPEHFDSDIRQLLSLSIDPESKVPYFKSAQVKVERA